MAQYSPLVNPMGDLCLKERKKGSKKLFILKIYQIKSNNSKGHLHIYQTYALTSHDESKTVHPESISVNN